MLIQLDQNVLNDQNLASDSPLSKKEKEKMMAATDLELNLPSCCIVLVSEVCWVPLSASCLAPEYLPAQLLNDEDHYVKNRKLFKHPYISNAYCIFYLFLTSL